MKKKIYFFVDKNDVENIQYQYDLDNRWCEKYMNKVQDLLDDSESIRNKIEREDIQKKLCEYYYAISYRKTKLYYNLHDIINTRFWNKLKLKKYLKDTVSYTSGTYKMYTHSELISIERKIKSLKKYKQIFSDVDPYGEENWDVDD
jgi:hypothetical protein